MLNINNQDFVDLYKVFIRTTKDGKLNKNRISGNILKDSFTFTREEKAIAGTLCAYCKGKYSIIDGKTEIKMTITLPIPMVVFIILLLTIYAIGMISLLEINIITKIIGIIFFYFLIVLKFLYDVNIQIGYFKEHFKKYIIKHNVI